MVQYRRDYIFESCVSVNGRYLIIKDNVFDLQEQKNIGSVWESIDVFKTIFRNTQLDIAEYKQIQESVENLPILESKDNLYGLRDILLEWSFFDDTWLGKELKSSGESIKNTFIDSYEGLKKFGVAISKGEWKEILSLLAKGTLYVLRKLKSAMYSAVGMTIDAILVATGIGKSVQWIPWALILGLDIYQMISNDWPDDEKNKPLWAKWLDIGFDVLGLVFAGVAAKGARALFAPLIRMGETSGSKIAAWLARNPKAAAILDNIIKGVGKVPSMMQNAVSFLSRKFPAGAKFLEKIVGRVGSMMTSLVESLKSLKSGYKRITGGSTKLGAGVRGGTETTGVLYGFEKIMSKNAKSTEDDLLKSITTSKVKPNWDNPKVDV